jgi:hypothetical protein
MPYHLDTSRAQADFRDDPWIVRGTPSSPWISTGSRLAWPPVVPSHPAMAECTCPTDCIRDHEND